MERNSLDRRLQHANPETRKAAWQELEDRVRKWNLDVGPYMPMVRAAIRSETRDDLVERIIGTLQNVQPSEARSCIDDVIERLRVAGDDIGIQRGWVAVLGHLGLATDKNVLKCLARLVASHGNPIIRGDAALALGELVGDDTAVASIFEKMPKDSDARVSIACAFGLWLKSKKPPAITIITNHLADPDAEARADAAGALYQIWRTPSNEQIGVDLEQKAAGVLRARIAVETNDKARFWMEQALQALLSRDKKIAKTE